MGKSLGTDLGQMGEAYHPAARIPQLECYRYPAMTIAGN